MTPVSVCGMGHVRLRGLALRVAHLGVLGCPLPAAHWSPFLPGRCCDKPSLHARPAPAAVSLEWRTSQVRTSGWKPQGGRSDQFPPLYILPAVWPGRRCQHAHGSPLLVTRNTPTGCPQHSASKGTFSTSHRLSQSPQRFGRRRRDIVTTRCNTVTLAAGRPGSGGVEVLRKMLHHLALTCLDL